MLITSASGSTAGLLGRHVRVPGLPDLNASTDFIATTLGGYMGVPAPEAVLVANGGGPGAVAAGEWQLVEEYLTLSGHLFADSPADIAPLHRLLVGAFPPQVDTPLVIVGNDWDVDKQMFVRRYDKLEAEQLDERLDFTIPLVAPDPYKYALEPLVGTLGTFTGQRWYREYAEDGGVWVRTYTNVDGVWVRTYEQTATDGPYPASLALESVGDATSQRVAIDVTGPLDAGDWFLENLLTGERLWAEVSVTAGQTLTFDCRARTARLSGASVDHVVYGDYLTLAPGVNTFRLSVGAASDANATISALPAYL